MMYSLSRDTFGFKNRNLQLSVRLGAAREQGRKSLLGIPTHIKPFAGALKSPELSYRLPDRLVQSVQAAGVACFYISALKDVFVRVLHHPEELLALFHMFLITMQEGLAKAVPQSISMLAGSSPKLRIRFISQNKNASEGLQNNQQHRSYNLGVPCWLIGAYHKN